MTRPAVPVRSSGSGGAAGEQAADRDQGADGATHTADAQPDRASEELRCTLCGLRACWTEPAAPR